MALDFNEASQQKIDKIKKHEKPKIEGPKGKSAMPDAMFGINIDFAMGIVKNLPAKIKAIIVYAAFNIMFTTIFAFYRLYSYYGFLQGSAIIVGALIAVLVYAVLSKLRINRYYKRQKINKK